MHTEIYCLPYQVMFKLQGFTVECLMKQTLKLVGPTRNSYRDVLLVSNRNIIKSF